MRKQEDARSLENIKANKILLGIEFNTRRPFFVCYSANKQNFVNFNLFFLSSLKFSVFHILQIVNTLKLRKSRFFVICHHFYGAASRLVMKKQINLFCNFSTQFLWYDIIDVDIHKDKN